MKMNNKDLLFAVIEQTKDCGVFIPKLSFAPKQLCASDAMFSLSYNVLLASVAARCSVPLTEGS